MTITVVAIGLSHGTLFRSKKNTEHKLEYTQGKMSFILAHN